MSGASNQFGFFAELGILLTSMNGTRASGVILRIVF